MAATIMTLEEEQSEKQFRRKNQWHSFTAAAWGALGGASFFAALGTVANALISASAGMGGTAAILGSPLTLGVIGGLLALGAAATYMSQKEATEVRVIQDEHLAQQQAKCAGLGKGLQQECEHELNQRADGKKWEQVVQVQPGAARQLH